MIPALAVGGAANTWSRVALTCTWAPDSVAPAAGAIPVRSAWSTRSHISGPDPGRAAVITPRADPDRSVTLLPTQDITTVRSGCIMFTSTTVLAGRRGFEFGVPGKGYRKLRVGARPGGLARR